MPQATKNRNGLRIVLLLFYVVGAGDSLMTTSPERLADLIEQAPLRAITGLSSPSAALREWATREIAAYLADGLDRPVPVRDAAQLALPL